MLHLQQLLTRAVVSAGIGALFYVIHDSGIYFEMSFSVITGHVEKDPSFIDWIRVSLVGQ